MPKTNVYPPGPIDQQMRRVEVGWQAATVQVATTELANPSNPTVGGDNRPEWRGNSYVDLDRHGINQLIRALREARDKAYGRDE